MATTGKSSINIEGCDVVLRDEGKVFRISTTDAEAAQRVEDRLCELLASADVVLVTIEV